eukprot:CAMPEP_0174749306 /NCGR_PEP_ID=MMETSP1094-20130205/95380_1 /TAXON_ID=156173 /ORGANISM="Chrysochromulina brevifilum, Strain UTEX LB 985" /LENGTH=147 /DNA_ID=CAMNT_0015954491 /DNA_START=219 /DNA_END=659 /DNA_ORIENTATION=-
MGRALAMSAMVGGAPPQPRRHAPPLPNRESPSGVLATIGVEDGRAERKQHVTVLDLVAMPHRAAVDACGGGIALGPLTTLSQRGESIAQISARIEREDSSTKRCRVHALLSQLGLNSIEDGLGALYRPAPSRTTSAAASTSRTHTST